MKVELVSRKTGSLRIYTAYCEEGETIYEAAEKAHIKLPISCRNGVCHVCRASLKSGAVLTGTQKIFVKGADHHENETEIMLCKTWPESDCTVEIEIIYGPGELPLKKVACQVLNVAVIKGHVYQVELQMPAGKSPEFYAGQYLALNFADREEPSFFSIASRPGLRTLTLHIQADPHLQTALDIISILQTRMQHKETVSVSLPYGVACLESLPNKPLILIAAGTGFAQMKAIVEHLQFLNFPHEVSLYWGVRKSEDLYMDMLASTWEKGHKNFFYHSIIADLESALETETGKNIEHHNQLSDAVLKDHTNLHSSMVFVSGSPRLVFATRAALMEQGLPANQFFSDVLESEACADD